MHVMRDLFHARRSVRASHSPIDIELKYTVFSHDVDAVNARTVFPVAIEILKWRIIKRHQEEREMKPEGENLILYTFNKTRGSFLHLSRIDVIYCSTNFEALDKNLRKRSPH